MSLVSICEGWEGRTVDGKFPLLEWLGGSKDRGVFLTVRQGVQTANIKLILAGGAEAEAYLAQWEAAKNLSHPSLTRVMETGRNEIDGHEFVYVVTERAEAVLSGIIPRKALDPGKANVIANRVADALGYVHDKGLVHGHVKPSNILLAADEWKLSGDGVHAAVEAPKRAQQMGLYDAPEVAGGRVTAAADVWSLGIILAESLAQRAPILNGSGRGEPEVPESLPEPFLEVTRGCLRRNPDKRYTIAEIKTLLAEYTSPPAEETRSESEKLTSPTESIKQAVEPVALAIEEVPDGAGSSRAQAGRIPVAVEPAAIDGGRDSVAEDSTERVAYPFGKVDPVDPAPTSRLFANIEDEEEEESRIRVAPIVFGVLILLLAIAGYFMARGYRIKLSRPAEKQSATAVSPPATQSPTSAETPTPAVTGQDATQPQAPAGQDGEEPATGESAAESQQPVDKPADAADNKSGPATGQTATQKPSKAASTIESRKAPITDPAASGQEEQPKPAQEAPHRGNTQGAVLERVLPNVSAGASSSMRAPVLVEVRVSVNEEGTVSSAEYISHGPGNYFARISHDAARSWKFTPPVKDGQPRPSTWTLRFQFDRKRTEVSAIQVR